MKIVICDDIKDDAMVTYEYLKRYYTEHQLPVPPVYHVTNAADLRKIGPMDLLFLDIELGEESGIALAAEMNQLYPDALVVFVSGYPYYVTDTYNVQAAQFFVKPLQYEIFHREYERILKRYEIMQDAFTRKDINLGEVVLHKSDIVYIESYKRILTVHTTDKKTYQYYGKIGDEEQFFEESTIVRCHRGYLINLAHVQNINRDGIVVKFSDGSTDTIAVSESSYDTVRNKFVQYISKR